jgi:hypothetical protein
MNSGFIVLLYLLNVIIAAADQAETQTVLGKSVICHCNIGESKRVETMFLPIHSLTDHWSIISMGIEVPSWKNW